MAVAAAVFEQRDIARLRASDFMGAIEDEAEIALFAAMQMPIDRIRTRIERRDEAAIDEDAHEQHAAIDARAFDVGAGVIGRADPGARLGDDARRANPLPEGEGRREAPG